MKKLKVTIYVGEQQVETLTKCQKEKLVKSLSDAMSIYYTGNQGGAVLPTTPLLLHIAFDYLASVGFNTKV